MPVGWHGWYFICLGWNKILLCYYPSSEGTPIKDVLDLNTRFGLKLRGDRITGMSRPGEMHRLTENQPEYLALFGLPRYTVTYTNKHFWDFWKSNYNRITLQDYGLKWRSLGRFR